MNNKISTHCLVEQVVKAKIFAGVPSRHAGLADAEEELLASRYHGRHNDELVGVEP
jgi:hypothetical protein